MANTSEPLPCLPETTRKDLVGKAAGGDQEPNKAVQGLCGSVKVSFQNNSTNELGLGGRGGKKARGSHSTTYRDEIHSVVQIYLLNPMNMNFTF